MTAPLPPLRVCSFESRRANEIRSLLERQGAVATVAPSMKEVPIGDNPAAFAFAEELLAARIHVMVFMTGVGARALLEALETRYPREAIFAAWDKCVVVVRGPKPVAVLREWNVRIDLRAPEPNTWRELLATLDAAVPLPGRRVAVQEYGVPNAEFYRQLEARGASVLSVPVYRWTFPDDTAPLQAAVEQTIAGEFDVLMFTSANQLHNVVEMANRLRKRDAWLAAAKQCVIASIGPTASETIHSYGLPVHIEPEHPKMGPLVKETVERAAASLAQRSPSGQG
jgi:uroporphyrinogen-III synthase